MRMSDLIAQFIINSMQEGDGATEIQRNDLADRMGCAPSQINYVIQTRFSPEHGYIVQSRRGGGGYIRIARINMDRPSMLMHTINAIGDTLDLPSAAVITENLVNAKAVSVESARVILAAVGSSALAPVPPGDRGKLRARIYKSCLLELANNN